MAGAHQTLRTWQLAVTLLLGFLCASLHAVPHSSETHLGSNHFASQIASAQCSEFAETLIREDRLIQLRLVSEITLRTTGDPIAFENPFRFSTKYVDIESGHLNYGRRLYNPTTGRWLSKDPIEEDGGLNLYGFVFNNPIYGYDILGLADDENYEPYSLVELGRLDRQAPNFYNEVERDFFDEGIPALEEYSWTFFPWGRLGRWADDAWRGGKAGATAFAKKGKNVIGWFKERFGNAPRYVQVKKLDPAADALAERLGGVSRVKFPGRFEDREFDFFTDKFLGQTKPENFKLGSAFRNQARRTFEAAIELGRTPYFHFDGPPSPSVVRKLEEYGRRFGIKPIIDTTPLGEM